MIIFKRFVIFASLITLFVGSTLQPAGVTLTKDKVRQCYQALRPVTLAEHFDVLDQNTALKTALYLRFAPTETQSYSSLMNAFDQQIKFRPTAVAALKQQGIDAPEESFVAEWIKGAAALFITGVIALKIASKVIDIEPDFAFAIAGGVPASLPVLEYLYFRKLRRLNPNSFRFINLSAPTRYQTFTYQAIDAALRGVIGGFAFKVIAPYAAKIGGDSAEIENIANIIEVIIALMAIPDKIIMELYVKWSRSKALADLKKLEKDLPAGLVTEVNKLVYGEAVGN